MNAIKSNYPYIKHLVVYGPNKTTLSGVINFDDIIQGKLNQINKQTVVKVLQGWKMLMIILSHHKLTLKKQWRLFYVPQGLQGYLKVLCALMIIWAPLLTLDGTNISVLSKLFINSLYSGHSYKN